MGSMYHENHSWYWEQSLLFSLVNVNHIYISAIHELVILFYCVIACILLTYREQLQQNENSIFFKTHNFQSVKYREHITYLQPKGVGCRTIYGHFALYSQTICLFLLHFSNYCEKANQCDKSLMMWNRRHTIMNVRVYVVLDTGYTHPQTCLLSGWERSSIVFLLKVQSIMAVLYMENYLQRGITHRLRRYSTVQTSHIEFVSLQWCRITDSSKLLWSNMTSKNSGRFRLCDIMTHL